MLELFCQHTILVRVKVPTRTLCRLLLYYSFSQTHVYTEFDSMEGRGGCRQLSAPLLPVAKAELHVCCFFVILDVFLSFKTCSSLLPPGAGRHTLADRMHAGGLDLAHVTFWRWCASLPRHFWDVFFPGSSVAIFTGCRCSAV